MIDKKAFKKIGYIGSVISLIVLVTFTISTILILNTNYLETGILRDETDKYRYIADDIVSQISIAEDVLGLLENNQEFISLLNTEHVNREALYTLYESIDFDSIFTNINDEYIYERLTIYTSNETAELEEKIIFISPNIADDPWYIRITQSRRKSIIFIEDNNVFLLYKMSNTEEPGEYTNIGVLTIDLAFLENVLDKNHKILFSNVFFNSITPISGDRILEQPINTYASVTESTYIEDEMVLVYTIIPGTSLTRWSLIIVLEPTNFIYNFISYAIVILSVIVAVAFMFIYKFNFIKKMDKSSSNLSFEDINESMTKDQPNKIDNIIQNMYTKIEALVKENQELDIINQQVEAQKNEAEIKALLSQIDPHYIFNILNSIHKRALKNKEMESARMILLMSKQLRRSLEWKEPLVSIKDEFEHVKSYVTLQEYYSGVQYVLKYNVDEKLYNMKVPKLMLQTLIENALKHGLATKPFNITLSRVNQSVRFVVENEVLGDTRDILNKMNLALDLYDTNDENEGIGLRNLVKRLKYYYKDGFNISIRAHKQNISVTVDIPEFVKG
jgi:two-component system, sensor histidine kinase YesM